MYKSKVVVTLDQLHPSLTFSTCVLHSTPLHQLSIIRLGHWCQKSDKHASLLSFRIEIYSICPVWRQDLKFIALLTNFISFTFLTLFHVISQSVPYQWPVPGKSYWGGRLSTVDLLVLTSLDQLIFIYKISFSFFIKQATLMRRSTVLILPPS